MSGAFLHCSITYIFERGSYWSSWPVVLWNPVSPCATSAGVTDMCCLAWLLHRFGGLKPGPHTCTANILPAEPSPQPPVSWFECLILS